MGTETETEMATVMETEMATGTAMAMAMATATETETATVMSAATGWSRGTRSAMTRTATTRTVVWTPATAASCGDGYLWQGNEACDDGNLDNEDGCEDDCTVTVGARKVVRGELHTCVLYFDGRVKCWGDGAFGNLGYGNTADIGDNETPDSIGFVDLGGPAVEIAAAFRNTCAVRDDGKVFCFGYNNYGQLGYGHTMPIGNDETPAQAGPIDLGDDAVTIGVAQEFACALTTNDTVRCWGHGHQGQLGLGNTGDIGDDEPPSSAPPLDFGENVVQLAVGVFHSCALLESGGVRCWGRNGGGQLGYGNTINVGDNEHPKDVPVVALGDETVVEVASGGVHNWRALRHR